ncbi:peptide chain release factor N(5)-glutamine methyltransferase [Pseudodesulfovibrio portus]|uniref:Release factor glutamine methyltransferase n=1 Tax=Pseudodesulfovibrio portus TaxID=231439 RepID=A0ABM8ANI4_9BACT|nr:peptide chain release factor N(5)-glutamine methyltransferase [Pseudodesulfovibrio portus]BDQ32876.1 release factor glutamine methyltransferase [Pseudodesulfovibrio portus]
MSPVIFDILSAGEARLAGVDSPRLSAELLVAHALDCSRMDLTLNRNRVPTDAELVEIESLLARREVGEPVAYILGEKEFYGLDFRVTPDTLIPRPETEHIIEEAESIFPKGSVLHFADLGTGSGILAVTLCVLFPGATGVAVDISPAALEVAKSNAQRHGVSGRIEFQHSDFTEQKFDPESFELVVSNPPYVTEGEFADASREVTGFEPTGALVSGVDGLTHIRAMLPRIEDMLAPGGYLFMEIGCGQGEAVQKIMCAEFSRFGDVRVVRDLAGLDRVVCARKL